MAARVKVEMNSAGIKALLSGSEMASHMRELADRVLDAAESSAPVDSGEYQDSLYADTEQTKDRVRGIVASTDPKALYVSAKTGNLSRALDAAGG